MNRQPSSAAGHYPGYWTEQFLSNSRSGSGVSSLEYALLQQRVADLESKLDRLLSLVSYSLLPDDGK